MSVGIERVYAYLPQHAVCPADLAAAQGVDANVLRTRFGIEEVGVAAACEDVATLAATAGARCLGGAAVDPASIGLLLLATASARESAVLAVHRMVGGGRRCRLGELTHGSSAGTTALMAGLDWVRAGGLRARRALVIAADVARHPFASPATPPQGAAAVAMLVSYDAQLLVPADESGIATPPPSGHDGGSCADVLVRAFDACRALERPPLEPSEGLSDRLARILYQTSCPAVVPDAHRRLIEHDWRAARSRWAQVEAHFEREVRASFEEQVSPGLALVARVGDVATAMLYLMLAGLLEQEARVIAGRRVGLFAYDSAGWGEFFTAFVPAMRAGPVKTGVAECLGRRSLLDAATYEHLRVAGEPPADFAGDFVRLRPRDGEPSYQPWRASR
jgi:hydroxymethylglutaryl-CoA synthase